MTDITDDRAEYDDDDSWTTPSCSSAGCTNSPSRTRTRRSSPPSKHVADERGWHPYDAYQALIAAPGGFAADLHPREGREVHREVRDRRTDRRFKSSYYPEDKPGRRRPGNAGRSTEIVPDPNDPGNPTIRVKLTSETVTPAYGTSTSNRDQVSAGHRRKPASTPARRHQPAAGRRRDDRSRPRRRFGRPRRTSSTTTRTTRAT